MNALNKDQETKSLSVAEYSSELARNGTRVVEGSPGTLWVRHESSAMLRFPMFHLTPPSCSEIRRVLWRGPAAVASYLLEPDETHPVNAYLYICTDRSYGMDKLSPAMRRNVRRGLKEVKIARTASEQVLAYGFPAFRDWLRRVGLHDETPEEFRRQFARRARCTGHIFLGAWKDDRLAAFLSVTELDQWAEIDGCFSADALLHLRPNDALFFYALSQYMNNGACRAVSYGVSSLQAVGNKDGLHAFKTKVGFEAIPVHRVFTFHPLLRPFANRFTLWALNIALRLNPGDRRLKKAEGMLACLFGQDRIPA